MNATRQEQKAKTFLALHHDPKLLVLPNIWDPLGARMLQNLGYPAVATASAAVAYSLGYDDGERISFAAMLDVIRRIVASVDIPVTADIERGYAESPRQLADRVRQVIQAGAVGINLEDSLKEGGDLYAVNDQCARLQAARKAADELGVHLVINARVDVFVGGFAGSHEAKLIETMHRAHAYRESGADCIYPILLSDLDSLLQIQSEIGVPINVLAQPDAPSMRELEASGISRLSLGPGLLKASLTTMRRIAATLQNHGSYDSFTRGIMSSDDIVAIVAKENMPGDRNE